MGYRHYFYLVDKKDVEKVKDKNYDKLLLIAKEYGAEVEDDGYFYFNDDKFMNKTEIYEFGKLYWDDTAERIYSHGVPLFTIEETQKAFSDYVPYVMGADGLLEAINIYKEKIINYYKSFLVDGEKRKINYSFEVRPEDIKDVSNITDFIEDRLRWWVLYGVIDLDLNRERISDSWIYEHQIFELVRLYKTIDWENKCLLFYGW